jgi:hypothetical protein
MNVRDVTVQPAPELRRVGIHYPNRLHVMESAVRIYRDLGIALEIEDNTIYLDVPRVAANWYRGAFERFTGTPAFNEWETHPMSHPTTSLPT